MNMTMNDLIKELLDKYESLVRENERLKLEKEDLLRKLEPLQQADNP